METRDALVIKDEDAGQNLLSVLLKEGRRKSESSCGLIAKPWKMLFVIDDFLVTRLL